MKSNQKIIGIIPARMKATRFPGKPVFPILGRPMIEHVFRRAEMFPKWDSLFLATCDREIEILAKSMNIPVIMTSDSHTRCLDRVAEAASICGISLRDEDIVVCVQGDEPMLDPAMIGACVEPLLMSKEIPCTVIAMEIVEQKQFENPNIVKIVHDRKGDIVYTSRAPIPYCKNDFSREHGARRIYGIFAWQKHWLQQFTKCEEIPLEIVEACDSNRIIELPFQQRMVPYPFRKSFSVDTPEDAMLVETHMVDDPLWGQY